MKPQIPTDPNQRWEWVKYQLRSQGSSFKKLSCELGVTDNAVINTKYLPYPRMERAIAKKLGLTPQTIWPERWNKDGSPCRQRPGRSETNPANKSRKDSGSKASPHRQIARGA